MEEHLSSVDILSQLKQLKSNREQGILSGIPLWEDMPRLGKSVPNIDKGSVIITSASSGIGKSQMARYMYIIQPWLYCRRHPEANINIKFVIFLLEDDKERLCYYLYSAFIYLKFNKEISPERLTSKHKEPLTELEVSYIEIVSPEVDLLLEHCIIHDSIYNTFGIYKASKLQSEEWGIHYYTELIPSEGVEPTIINREDYNNLKTLPTMYSEVSLNELRQKYQLIPSEYKEYWKYSHYTPHDKNQHVITIIDNVNCLNPDKYEGTLKNAIGKLMYSYLRTQIAKNFNWSVIAVQQNVASAESKQYTRDGSNIIDSLVPSLDKLADDKTSQRAAHLVYSLFSPHRYGLKSYMGYDIKRFGNRIRFLFLLKNNNGIADIIIPLLFVGGSSLFFELPDPDDINYNDYSHLLD